MGAKDTVIQFDGAKLTPFAQGFLKGALRDQAETTWRAREPEIAEARREVVEWVEENIQWRVGDDTLDKFEAKLKEWGIK